MQAAELYFSAYYLNDYSGTVNLIDRNKSVNLSFLPYAYLDIKAEPEAFTVLFNGKQMSVNTSISMKLVGGNYTISIMSSGYISQNMTLNISPGSHVQLLVDLQKVKANTSLSQLGIYAIIGGVGAMIGIIWGAVVFRKK